MRGCSACWVSIEVGLKWNWFESFHKKWQTPPDSLHHPRYCVISPSEGCDGGDGGRGLAFKGNRVAGYGKGLYWRWEGEVEALPRTLTARRCEDFSQKAPSRQGTEICMETDLWKLSQVTSLRGLPTVILAPHLELSLASLLNVNWWPSFNRHLKHL